MESDTFITKLKQQAQEYFIKGNYHQAASCYEQAISADPENRSYYWHLGLMLLLQGQEAEAQMTWLLGIGDEETEQIEQLTAELIQVLQTEAERREELIDYSVAWLIRQHIREINPTDINNLLHLIELSIHQENFTGDELDSLGVTELIQSETIADIPLLLQVLENLLNYAPLDPSVFKFTEACLTQVQVTDSKSFINIIIPATVKITYSLLQTKVAIPLLELCLRLEPENIEVLRHLAAFYRRGGDSEQGIEVAKRCYSLSKTLIEKVCANYLLQQCLIETPGHWQEANQVFLENELTIRSLIAEKPQDLPVAYVMRLFNSNYFAPYFRDEPQQNRQIQNQVSQFCQLNVENYASEEVQLYRKGYSSRRTKLKKIGYVSHCLSKHSVGWLARWLIQYHDREKFDIYGYFVNYKQVNDPLQEWYVQQFTKSHKCSIYGDEITEKIYEDGIDILIDLDSITLDTTCEIMAHKPAPVQVTWLGLDASGVPTIDYFIADPYVLPESAQEYYTEKIWRLPQTYIAVDGFEVGVPNLRRDDLDIPSDAIVYFCIQRGFKRHPETVSLQMKIIKEVPNSYLLIKGIADSEVVQQFFIELAAAEGVESSRLRFLPMTYSEGIHRANLTIADIVLDTYPYNGATTTLETLWMGIPLVTRVGEQFAARNSYTMMINAGITEGIAWTDEEYVEWGVRLGKDSNLRQQVAWKLRESRHTAPLWNAKQFTRDMENAYEQMWQRYLDS